VGRPSGSRWEVTGPPACDSATIWPDRAGIGLRPRDPGPRQDISAGLVTFWPPSATRPSAISFSACGANRCRRGRSLGDALGRSSVQPLRSFPMALRYRARDEKQYEYVMRPLWRKGQAAGLRAKSPSRGAGFRLRARCSLGMETASWRRTIPRPMPRMLVLRAAAAQLGNERLVGPPCM